MANILNSLYEVVVLNLEYVGIIEGYNKPMKITFEVSFSVHREETQFPYFSVTGEINNIPTSRDCKECGMLHDRFMDVFPDLAYILPWHCSSLHGFPVHYVENAMYWRKYGSWKNFENQVVIHGVNDITEEMFHNLSDPEMKELLEKRKPHLTEAFKQMLRKLLSVNEINTGERKISFNKEGVQWMIDRKLV